MSLFVVIATILILIKCADGRYNILFLQSDQMDGRVLDPASPFWNILEMPNLRALASNGINFVNTYSNSPLCAPSRTSMFAGRYINNISAWSNVQSLTAQVTNPNAADHTCANIVGYNQDWCIQMGKKQNVTTTIKQTMESAGYIVQLFGKMDIGGGMSVDANNTIDANGYHCPYNGNWSNALGGCNTTTTPNYCPGDLIHSLTRKANITRAQWLPPYEGNWIRPNSKQGGSQTPHDENVTHNCINWLDNFGKNPNKSESEPFLLYCSMINPHPPYWSNSTWFKYLNYTALNASFHELIKNFNGTFNSMNEADQFNSISENIGDVDIDTDWAYNLYQSYFGSCVELDYWMGLIINKLKEYPNLYENTLILYTSDHGELHLEHLQVEKMSLYEPSVRVPLIVKGPNIDSNKVIRNNFTSLVDIFPTFLDTGNVSYSNEIYPKNLNGYSLSPFFNWNWINKNKNNPYLNRSNYVFSEYHGDCTNTGQFMLRQNEYKLILYGNTKPYQNYKPQLFNLMNDKYELKNIANENKEIVQSMTNTLNDLLIKTGGGDYNFVDQKCENESKQNFKRWQNQINNGTKNLWINYTNATYVIFNENDLQKIQKWVNS